MLDPKRIRSNPDEIREALKKRGAEVEIVDRFLAVDEKWRAAQKKVEDLTAEQKKASAEIPKLKKEGKPVDAAMAAMKKLSDEVKILDQQAGELEAAVRNEALLI